MLQGRSHLRTANRVNTTIVQFLLCKSEQLPLSVLCTVPSTIQIGCVAIVRRSGT